MDLNQNDFCALIGHAVNTQVLGKFTDSYDLLTIAKLSAAMDSANYYVEHMSTAKNCASNLELLTHAMKLRKVKGLALEFGVASGKTINHLSTLTRDKVYGFDAFTGLPEKWRVGFEEGAFAQSLPEVNANVELVVGLFDETLPKFVSQLEANKIAFLHIDCDLYSSTRTIFQYLASRIVAGTVIVFDEYFNYPGWRQHEFKAFMEFCEDHKMKYRYDSFVSRHQQVCVQIESVG